MLVAWFGDKEAVNNVELVGGKNASLSHLFRVMTVRTDVTLKVPNGFALTTHAYRQFVDDKVQDELRCALEGLDEHEGFPLANLPIVSKKCREIVYNASRPGLSEKNDAVWDAVITAYHDLSSEYECFPPNCLSVAVRSSASAEDLPHASFAGQMESFLNVSTDVGVIEACRHCMASVYTSRAIAYRRENRFDDCAVKLSVGVMPMIRADVGASGVLFTCETETGHDGFIEIEGVFGLGESLVLGKTVPDQYLVHKATFNQGYRRLISKRLGSKEVMMQYASPSPPNAGGEESKYSVPEEQDYHYHYQSGEEVAAFAPTGTEHAICSCTTPKDLQHSWTLSEEEAMVLADDALEIERIYNRTMDIEWAKDGTTGKIYILQARPETVSAARRMLVKSGGFKHYEVSSFAASHATVLCTGTAVGDKIASGHVRVITDPSDPVALGACGEGDILVCPMTNPDLVPVMRKASAVVTERGGRTSHASIVCREYGLPCVVGAVDAMTTLSPGLLVTVSCCEGEQGKVYAGEVPYTTCNIGDLEEFRSKLPSPAFVRINIGEPSQAMAVSSTYPHTPVGLVRMEFVISQEIRIHPMALVALSAAEASPPGSAVCACCAASSPASLAALRDRAARLPVTETAYIRAVCADYECPGQWFVQTLAQNLATIASAFYPEPVLIRTSDFKTNEYEALIGAALFEKHEENPLLGFRGAARYTDPSYETAFRLEVKAINYLRDELGLTNVEVLVPFVRSPEEGAQVRAILLDEGASATLKVNLMCELPTNALLLEDYLEHFDGVSIGTNDLAMLTCGIDRDSADLARRYGGGVDEATYRLMCLALDKGLRAGKCVGICGEAATNPDLLRRLLAHGGLGYLSVNPGSLVPVMREVGAILDSNPSIRKHNQHSTLPTLRRGHPQAAGGSEVSHDALLG